ncbi:MAG: hypothetical protein V3S69_00970 [Dehalococcoidales bacterium]
MDWNIWRAVYDDFYSETTIQYAGVLMDGIARRTSDKVWHYLVASNSLPNHWVWRHRC